MLHTLLYPSLFAGGAEICPANFTSSQLIVSEKITEFQTGGNGGQLGVAKVAHPEEGCVAQQWQTSSRKLGFSGLKVKLRRWAMVSFCSLDID